MSNETKRYAVIDLGTNTFHVFIAEKVADDGFQELHRHRIFVKLAEEGIQKIGQSAYKRALSAAQSIKEKLVTYKVQKVKAFGTAALRTASNGPELVADILSKTGIRIELISGQEEARLIHLGVQQVIPPIQENSLIMDIGGGSVEFIFIENQKVIWAQSFPIGVAVLYKQFHHSNPINSNEIKDLKTFLAEQLEPLKKFITTHPVHILIGASGTFDVLENVLTQKEDQELFSQIPASKFPSFYQKLILTTKEERYQLPEIPDTRADMIVVAVILIDFILQSLDIKSIFISSYAMKEGMMSELID